jgi:hypothetical protein
MFHLYGVVPSDKQRLYNPPQNCIMSTKKLRTPKKRKIMKVEKSKKVVSSEGVK